MRRRSQFLVSDVQNARFEPRGGLWPSNGDRYGLGGNSMSLLFTLTLDGDTLMASGLTLVLDGSNLEAA